MIDSSAKLPSGILRGNLNQFGDFDECINVSNEYGLSGQYCLVAIKLKQSIFSNEINAYHQVKNNLTDVSYKICIFKTLVFIMSVFFSLVIVYLNFLLYTGVYVFHQLAAQMMYLLQLNQ